MNEERIKIFSDKYFSRPDELENRVNNFLKEIQVKGYKVLGIHITCRASDLLVVCVRYIAGR